MAWNKQEIKIEDVPALKVQLQNMIKTGNPVVENMRCFYKFEDESICHMLTVFDFLDNPPQNKITKFILYQMVN